MASERTNLLLVVTAFSLAASVEGESFVKKAQHEIHEKLGPLKAAVIPSSMADEIFFQILTYYAPVDAESERCRNDSGRYVEAALRNDLWALQMFDASSKLEPGTLDGNFQGLGSYDACLGIDTPENFVGQHCLVEILGLTVPAIDHLLTQEDDTLLPIQPLNPLVSLCVPSTCTYRDVETHMNVALEQLNGTARLNSRSCATRNPEPWDTKDYAAVSVISGILGLVLLSSLCDYVRSGSTKVKSAGLLCSFSLFRNVPKLRPGRSSDELPSINGLRFIAIVWIVIGHRYIIGFSVPNFGLTKPEIYLQDWSMAPVHSLMLGVEIFLLLSGLLVTYNFLKSMEDHKSFNIPKFYFHRYMRITPVYAMMILVDGIILYHLSDGPVWKRLTGPHRDICTKNWLPGLLYISNYYYISSFRTCVPQTWYLSTDMQLYFISPLLLIPLHKRPKLGLSLIFACFAATISASFINANYYELKTGSLITTTRKTERNFDLEYTKTHLRSASYFIGLALGYFVYKYKQGLLKVNLSKRTLMIGWLISAQLMFGVIYTISIFQNNDYHGSQLIDSLHIALYRPVFALGVVWVVFMGITGNGGFVNKMLSLPILKPMAALTYGIYMTHLTFQTIEVSRTRVAVDYTPFDLMVKSTTDIAASIVAAVVMFLAVEAPFVEIDKWLFSKDCKEKEENADLPTLPVHITEKTQL